MSATWVIGEVLEVEREFLINLDELLSSKSPDSYTTVERSLASYLKYWL